MRPHIICHMGTSIDGRLHPSRFTKPAADIPADALRSHYERIHDGFIADGWVIGRVTMASFFEADVTVSVRLRSEPALAEGDILVLYLDNEPVQGSPNATDYTLSGLDRGGHTLVAQILDAKGKEKIRSESVVFSIKHVTVIPPKAVGPNVKPPTATRPPRPTPRGG